MFFKSKIIKAVIPILNPFLFHVETQLSLNFENICFDIVAWSFCTKKQHFLVFCNFFGHDAKKIEKPN